MKEKRRCPWVPNTNPLYIAYHDTEWGVPVYDDVVLFEFLVLESAQAGLSWLTVLKKREEYRKAFKNFNPRVVARFTDKDIERLLQNPGIIRNRAKIVAAINNAQRFLEIQKEFGSFSNYMWGFVKNVPIHHHIKTKKDYPTTIREAEVWAADLKKRGFRFFGPTICYAHMQAVGMVHDHSVDCFRYKGGHKHK